MKTILIGRAHGANIPGKCSPEAGTGSEYDFREWKWSREMCGRLRERLQNNPEIIDRGIVVQEVIRQDEDNEPPLRILRDRCNVDDAFAIWLHCNAAGADGKWHTAHGFSIWTCRGLTCSDAAATSIFHEFDNEFPDLQKRTDRSDGDVDFESNFNVLMFTPPSVLLETLFQDNKDDVLVLKSEDFKIRFLNAIEKSIVEIIRSGTI